MPALEIRRISKSESWRKIFRLRLWFAKRKHARNIRNRVERLQPCRERNLLVNVIQSEIESEIWSDFPVVLNKSIEEMLIAVVGRRADSAFAKTRLHVAQEEIEIRILIIASLALHKRLRRNDGAPVNAKLERMPAEAVGRLIDNLVAVLDRKLRRVLIWSN